MKIPVIAKVSGWHPASGLTLVAGKAYEIDEAHFGDQVFDRAEAPKATTKPAGKAAKDQPEGGNEA